MECNEPFQASGISTGYVMTGGSRKICYSCADDLERQYVAGHNDWIGYLSSKENAVTSWSGGKIMRTTRVSPGEPRAWSLSGRLTYVNTVDDQGKSWFGKGAGEGMSIRMHRAKADRIEEEAEK